MTDEEKRQEHAQQKEEQRKALRDEVNKIRGMHGKKRFQYLWDYYKFVILILIALVFVISIAATMIKGAMTDVIFQAAVISADSGADDSLIRQDFTRYCGGLSKNQEMSFDLSMDIHPGAATQAEQVSEVKLQVSVAASAVDAVLVPEYAFDYLQERGLLMKLDSVLGQEQLDAYEKAGDLAFGREPDLEKLSEEAETEGRTMSPEMEEAVSFAIAMNEEETARDKESENPEDSGTESLDTVDTEREDGKWAYGIRVDDGTILPGYALYPAGQRVYFGIVDNTKHVDMALRFLDFLKGE